MEAWVVVGAGSPVDVMERVSVDVPEPGPGELRVRVLVAGTSLPEVLMCRGTYAYKPARPFTPGHEVAGLVTDPGPGGAFEIGQRVMGVTAFYGGSGGHAEQAILIESSASPVPDAMSDEHAAVFTIGYQTGYLALAVRAGLVEGETLLVHGAAGGSGFAAVQLGRALGARVIAVARGAEKSESCRRDGAHEVIDSATTDWVAAARESTQGRGVDVVFDPVGGDVFRQSLGCLAYGGRLIPIGFASGAWGEVPTVDLVSRNASVVGVLAVPPDDETAREMKQRLVDWYEQGVLEPRVSGVVDFEQVPQALADLEARRVIGKQVVRVSH